MWSLYKYGFQGQPLLTKLLNLEIFSALSCVIGFGLLLPVTHNWHLLFSYRYLIIAGLSISYGVILSFILTIFKLCYKRYQNNTRSIFKVKTYQSGKTRIIICLIIYITSLILFVITGIIIPYYALILINVIWNETVHAIILGLEYLTILVLWGITWIGCKICKLYKSQGENYDSIYDNSTVDNNFRIMIDPSNNHLSSRFY